MSDAASSPALPPAADPGPGAPRGRQRIAADHPHYRWVALSNTTLGVLLAALNSSIVIISLPAIFRGIGIDPLAAGNTSYLLWMLLGYLLVSAVLVVTLGRLGDIYGRVKIYNAGFTVFTAGSVLLAVDPLSGGHGALWLIGFRVLQGIGGAMLQANSTAILTDAFPATQRGTALGINQVAALAGSFLGLVVGGLLSEWDWRAVFLISVPLGLLGTTWSYLSLHDTSLRTRARIDWWGNATFAVGLTALLAGVTYGIQPYGGHTEGWTNPWVLAGLIGGAAVLVVFGVVERRVANPMFHLELFRLRAFTSGNAAWLLAAIARGGMQFMLIIWLQGVWLPLHGYAFADTPLWAGVYLVPLTIGFLVAGPLSGRLSDRLGARPFAAGGMLLAALSFVGLLLLPIDFSYWLFALLIALNGVGSGLFAAPNTTMVMNVVPAGQRGAASGMRATFFNGGQVLSIGIFFSLLVAGLASSLPTSLRSGLLRQGVPAAAADRAASLPPVGSVFSAFLGVNPIRQLLGPHVLASVTPAQRATLVGRSFFPHLISQPVHRGLLVVFALAAVISVLAALVSLTRGGNPPGAPEPGAATGAGQPPATSAAAPRTETAAATRAGSSAAPPGSPR